MDAERRAIQSERMKAVWANPQLAAKQAASIRKNPKCRDCGEKDISNFHVDKNGNRKAALCKKCHKKACKARYESMTSVERWAEKAVRYGITAQEALALLETQKGKCAICEKKPSTKRGLHIDHCHKTGQIRGLLCHGCNVGIGSLKDDPELLTKAVEYLRS